MANFLDTGLKMEYGDYWGSIEKVPSGFRGHLLGIRHVMRYSGRTISELRTNFRITVDDYLKHCDSTGRVPERTSDSYVSYPK